jgi:hypothetical protein
MTLRSPRSSKAAPLFLALSLGTAACGPVAKTIPKAATSGIVEGGLKAMDDPENKQRLAHILASPEVKQVQQELVSQVVDGSLAALSEKDRVERLGEISARFAAGLVNGFSKEVAPQLGPATSAAMRGVMDGTMNVAMSDEHQRQMARLLGSLVQASVDPVLQRISEAELGTSMSSTMTKELGPAFEKVLRDNLGPGLAEALSREEVKRALGETAHTLGREIVLGAHEGLATMRETKEAQDSGLLGSMTSLAHQGATLGKILPWVMLAALLGMVAWVVKLLSQTRRYRTENEERAETTRVLAEAIRAAEGKPWSGELLTALEERFRDDEEAVVRIQAARAGRIRRSSELSKAH